MTRFKTEAQGNSDMAVLDTDLLGKPDEELSINLCHRQAFHLTFKVQ